MNPAMRPHLSNKTPRVTVQRVSDAPVSDDQLQAWVSAVFSGCDGEITVRMVDRRESRELNYRYRGNDRATNVLAFPAPDPIATTPGEPRELGDVVICGVVVQQEAADQGKDLEAHWAHMVIHGCLHLRGFDHVDSDDAHRMEARECSILSDFGFPNPYE